MPFNPGEQKTHDKIHAHENNKAKLEEMRQDIEHPDLLTLIDEKLNKLEQAGDSVEKRIDAQEKNIVEHGGDLEKMESELEDIGNPDAVVERVEGEMEKIIDGGPGDIVFPEDLEERKEMLLGLLSDIDTSSFDEGMQKEFRYLESSIGWSVDKPSFSFHRNEDMIRLLTNQEPGRDILKYLLLAKTGDGLGENQAINTIIQEDSKFLETSHFKQIRRNLIAEGIRNKTLFQGYTPDPSDELVKFPESKIDFFHQDEEEELVWGRRKSSSEDNIFDVEKTLPKREKRKKIYYQERNFIVNLERFTHDANAIDLLSAPEKQEIGLVFKDTVEKGKYIYTSKENFIDEIIRVGQKLGIEESEVQEYITHGIVNALKRGAVVDVDLQNELGPISKMVQEIITNPELRSEIVQELGVYIAKESSAPPGSSRWQEVIEYLDITPLEQESLLGNYLDFSIESRGSGYRIKEVFGYGWRDDKSEFTESQKEQAFETMSHAQRASVLESYDRAIFDNNQEDVSRISFLPFEGDDIIEFLQKRNSSSSRISWERFEKFQKTIEKISRALGKEFSAEKLFRKHIFANDGLSEIKSILEKNELGTLNESLALLTDSQKEDFVRGQITYPTSEVLQQLEELYLDPEVPDLPRLNDELAAQIYKRIHKISQEKFYSDQNSLHMVELPEFLPKESRLDFALDEKIQDSYTKVYKELITGMANRKTKGQSEEIRRYINDADVETSILDNLMESNDITGVKNMIRNLDGVTSIPSEVYYAAKKYLLNYIEEIGGDASDISPTAHNDSGSLEKKMKETNTQALMKITPDNLPEESQLKKMFDIKYEDNAGYKLEIFIKIKKWRSYEYFNANFSKLQDLDAVTRDIILDSSSGQNLDLFDESIARNNNTFDEYLTKIYLSRFKDGRNQVEKNYFFEKINSDTTTFADNKPLDSKDSAYEEFILKKVYPQRNYNTYKYLDQYEDRTADLESYIFDREGYEMKFSGVLGYKIKESETPQQEIIDEFSGRIEAIKALASEESIRSFLNAGLEESQAQTTEGKILEYFGEHGYTMDTMNVLLGYQLIGSYDDFVASSADRLSLEEDPTSKNYILLDELVNQYGDNMKETIKDIQQKVAQSQDVELFAKSGHEKDLEKYQSIGEGIIVDLGRIPSDRITDQLLQKKILKTVKNTFQSEDNIKGRAEYFSSLFSKNDLEDFSAQWGRHINELFVVDDQHMLDMGKIEGLQSAVYQKLQAEISKYEEIKEVDEAKGETKLSKERSIQGYFSKNKENAHARMVADVCLANDPNMLKSENYFEFVLFDQGRRKCMGTTMLLNMEEPDGKKYLLYAPNPSVGLVSEVSAKKLYQTITRQITQFAQENNFDGILLNKTHGHATNRAGLFQQTLEQSCLKDGTGKELSMNLKEEHVLSGGYKYKENLQAVWLK